MKNNFVEISMNCCNCNDEILSYMNTKTGEIYLIPYCDEECYIEFNEKIKEIEKRKKKLNRILNLNIKNSI